MIGGWFPDPDGAPGRLRWWDGARWTDHTVPAGSPEALAPPRVGPPPSWWRRLLGREGPDRDEPPASSFTSSRGGLGGEAIPPTGVSGLGAPPAPGQPRPPGPPPAPGGDVIAGREPSGRRVGPVLGTTAVIAALIAALVFAVVHFVGGSSSDEPVAGPTPTASESLSPLQRLCRDTGPVAPDPHAQPAPAPTGPRVDDPKAGISYLKLPAPFRSWDLGVWDAGSLGEQFSVGQYFVTQAVTPQGGPYLATVLSGTVPAAYGDNPHPNIECAGKVVAADVRGHYYPRPNTRTDIAAEPRSVDGHPAYLIQFHLSFDRPGYTAKGELVAICVIDIGQPQAAVVYMSIPDTHRQYDSVVSRVIDSVRVGR